MVVFNRAVGHLVAIAQIALSLDQVFQMQARGKGMAAAAAVGCFALFAHLFIKAHADLGRALKDVEELAEGQP